MKLPTPSLAVLALPLLASSSALAMDQRQADALCASWKLECPAGSTSTSSGPGKGTGALECKKGGLVKEGPAVTCRAGKAVAWGDWKAGKKQGLQVTMRPNGSWTEELFAEGKQQGRSVEYSAEGQLLKEAHFQAGKKHGPERTFEEDGKLAAENFWDKGVKIKKPVEAVAASKPAARPAEPAAKAKEKAQAAPDTEAPADDGASPAETAEAPADKAAPSTAEAPAPMDEGKAPASEGDAQANSPSP